ncbi:aldehyde dehydrogenase, dimeric NADP-preferring-like [Onthophagus taurus]|uniref:aldehyde dehydrogenase, dimeric NADP-preferring-like n=1 Tax=Onthophagus taurus TaxID=166361 RepID=UPI000C20A911|nr:aldehyde dehydrogenase, dimeric NADP-preferring-like [Onthophagus taurus]
MTKTPQEIVKSAREAFDSGKTIPLEFREKQLKSLLRMYEENEEEMLEALKQDLNKSRMEATLTEISILKMDIKEQITNLKEWAKPEKPPKPVANIMDEALIYKDPYGVVLVISAWNYPINLAFLPVTGAIAAGNCVIIKPSEISPASAEFVRKTLPKYLDNECYQVMCGGVPETSQLLKEKFDYIFFTGSTHIGKIVYAAANENLTPVTLELGGKSPVFIDDDTNIDVATRRILWGKCMNAGQTCIAPDYILCSKKTQDKFVETAKKILKEWYGDNPQKSDDLCRIVSDQHFKRVSKYLKDNGKIATGGKCDADDKFVEPTILIDVKPNDPVMQDEIFGPILPILTVHDSKEAIDFIRQREKPLAMYIFSENRPTIDKFLRNTSSGGVCVNDTLMHLGLSTLPFGGVGSSGMGHYHGKYTFDTFVHRKSILVKNLNMIGEKILSSRYPPYSQSKLKRLQMALEKTQFEIKLKYVPYMLIFGLGLITSFLARYFVEKQKFRS